MCIIILGCFYILFFSNGIYSKFDNCIIYHGNNFRDYYNFNDPGQLVG